MHEFYRRVLENDLLAPYFENAEMGRLMDHLMKATECLDNGVPENRTGMTVMASK